MNVGSFLSRGKKKKSGGEQWQTRSARAEQGGAREKVKNCLGKGKSHLEDETEASVTLGIVHLPSFLPSFPPKLIEFQLCSRC